ncbi:heterokaryon incompatibility protein-domain-containing protein [Paraphoma chrysanthemicola]|nr:heterokaryon incompatibility protein-domain-containing protein [Paraphoma chrysanthemicola]
MAAPTSSAPSPDVLPSTYLQERSRATSLVEDLAMNDMSQHQHTPLKNDISGIRLLEILSGPSYEPIRCRLSQHDLDDLPSYIALSYTWEQGQQKSIVCDEMCLDIGDNLWQFLLEYRKKRVIQENEAREQKSDTSFLWIDAICIDQSNLMERNQQVAQMRMVYTKAHSVIVWLGLACEHEELAFLLTRHPDLLEHSKFQASLLSLLRKPYFTRVWVVQEFVLAKSVDFWCGQLIGNALAFEKVWYEDRDLPGLPELSKALQQTSAWPLFSYRRNFWSSDVDTKKRSESFHLRNLLFSFSASRSSEAYDTVYGFLGIALQEPDATHSIQPDYSKPAVELLADVLRDQCCRSGTSSTSSDYDLMVFLLSRLRVSRVEFAKYLMRCSTHLEEHLFVLAVSEFIIATVFVVDQIGLIGSYEHITELSPGNAKSAMVRSSVRVYPTKLPRWVSHADIRGLSLALTDPETMIGLELNKRGRGEPVLQALIHRSTDVLLRGICCSTTEQSAVEQQQWSASAQLDGEQTERELQQIISQSVSRTSEKYRVARHAATARERRYRHGTYAAFIGSDGDIGNNLAGVLCDESNFGSGPREKDAICVFASKGAPNKAFIMSRVTTSRHLIKGAAIVIDPKPEFGSERRVQSFQNILRKGETQSPRPRKTLCPSPETPYQKFCFHCNLTDLLELSRCGILNASQMDHILEQSLLGNDQDQVHKCSLGTGQLPSLEFAK